MQGVIPFDKTDTVTTIKYKLTAAGFVDYSYNYNYFIGIEVSDIAKSLIKITKVEKADEEIEDVNYEYGVTDVDFFNNVRFELNPYGLIAMYNKAPVIVNSMGDIEAVKSLNVDDYDLLNGIEVSDDKDKLNKDNITIRYNGSDDPSALILGDNNITLTIIDDWGRESEVVTFNLALTSAMDNINIDFLYAGNGLIPDLNQKAATLTFDMENGRISVANGTENFKFFNDSLKVQYGGFAIIGKDGTVKYQTVLGPNRNFDLDDTIITGTILTNYPRNFKTEVEKISIEYGDEILIRIYQSPFVYINGNVINSQEDYSEGAYLSEILNTSTFTITEEGLVQNYTKPESVPKNNDIVWLSGVAGQKLFNINVNPDTKRLTVTNYSTEPLDTLYNDNSDLFSINIYDSNGNYSYGIDAHTRQYATDIGNALNNKEFEIGGYMTIKIHPTDRNRVRNMKIYGDIIKTNTTLQNVDYSDEIKDVAYYNESRFYFTEDGLSLSYNEAPTFTGLTDVILLKGQTEGLDLRENVEVYDDNTKDIDYTIEDANGQAITNTDSYIPPSLGAHEVYYVATDSLGRTAREARFIWLQSASIINLKDESLLTIQEADPDLQTEDQIVDYLINLVTVYDDEDNANENPIIITKDNITGTFDTNTPGEYPITYTVEDSDGNITEVTFEINVVRTISVSVPIYIPFQIVTNLIAEPDNPTITPDPFVSGIMNVTNNYLTDVDVYLKEFTKESNTGDLEIVSPNTFSNWNELTDEETMKYMALGIYNKSNLENSVYTKGSPLWLEEGSTETYIGTLPKASTLDQPNSSQLSFVSKHGTNFIGGTSAARFNLILEFR